MRYSRYIHLEFMARHDENTQKFKPLELIVELGEYLRKCRDELNRTQPSIAQEVDIEQSYLSKLESGKSLPSEEVFTRLTKVYNIDINDMISHLDSSELDKLSEIKLIKETVHKKTIRQAHSSNKWLISGLLLLMLGVGSLAMAIIPDRSEKQFNYRSEGVLLPSEDLDIYDLVYESIDDTENSSSLMEKRKDLLTRLDQIDQASTQNRGDGYVLNTKEGRRYFKLISTTPPTRNYAVLWYLVPALMCLTGGFGSLLIARRYH